MSAASWARTLFWALIGLIMFGIVAIFVSIPNGHIIYAVAGPGSFGAFTLRFNRLRRASADSAIVIAASIFLDVFNIFVLLLDLFGRVPGLVDARFALAGRRESDGSPLTMPV